MMPGSHCILETDASGVGLGNNMLQVRGNLNCRHDKVPASAMLQLITCSPVRAYPEQQQ